MQKGVGVSADEYELAAPLDLEPAQLPHRIFRLTLNRAERSEVMRADQHFGRRLHALRVKRAVFPGNTFCPGSRAHGAIEDHIAIMAAGRGKTCMEIEIDFVRPQLVSKWITWPQACTPASVRPATVTRIGSSATEDNACSTQSCTVRAPSCHCQPEKREPSYSIIAAIRMGVLYTDPARRTGENPTCPRATPVS